MLGRPYLNQLYTSYEWNCFSYSKIAMNCYSKNFAKFVDFIFFLNVFGTTLSYAVLIQGNMVTSFGFIRSKYWPDMPEVLDDPSSIFWVIAFGVLSKPDTSDHADSASHQATAEEFDDLFLLGIPNDHLHHGRHHKVHL